MVFKLNHQNREITQVSRDAAQAALKRTWQPGRIRECLFGAVVLETPSAFYCQNRFRLEEILTENRAAEGK